MTERPHIDPERIPTAAYNVMSRTLYGAIIKALADEKNRESYERYKHERGTR